MEQGFEYLSTDFVVFEAGPYHASLPGQMRLKLTLDGEIVSGCECQVGFTHKGLEKTFERQKWNALPVFADHVDPEAAVFGEWALCLAVEEIIGLEVPKRAQHIRILLSELVRASSHLGYVARVARVVGAETMMQYVLRDREKILDLFELLTGMRFSFNFLCYGGVREDVTEGFIERVLDVCELIKVRIKEYNDLFSFNQAFVRRATGVGVMDLAHCRRFAITGPNARAAGIRQDIRVTHPYGHYSSVDVKLAIGSGEFGVQGDSYERYLLRLREIAESIEIARQIADHLPSGSFRKEGPLEKVPAGETYARVESPRGLLGCLVVSDGSEQPVRVQFRTPSSCQITGVPELLTGCFLEDVPLILASLDLSVPEVDR